MEAEKLHAESIAISEERAQLEAERAAFLREKHSWNRTYAKIAPRRYRLFAWLVDLWTVSLIAQILSGILPGEIQTYSWYIVYVLVMVGMTGWFGQTLGKMIFDLKVVMRNDDKLGFSQAILRETIGRFVSIVTLIGLLFPFFNRSQLTIHDYIANTSVNSILDE